MTSTLLPPDGAKTVWEDHCILVHLDNSKDASGEAKLLPSVLLSTELPAEALPQRAAVYPPDASGDGGEDGAGRAALLDRLASHLQAAASQVTAPLAFVWSKFLSGCQPRATTAPLDWHPRHPWLAAADTRGRVQVVDLAPDLRPPVNGTGTVRPEVLVSGPGKLKAVLAHEALQNQALSLAWCPTSPGLLAVGAAGAVGLWALAGEARPPLAAAGRASGPWLRLLRTRVTGARVTSLSWSPDGRLLAAASPDQAGLQVWEVASGVPTAVAAGPAAFDTVRWSPCGNYVFAAGTGSRFFYIFETQRWRWARWQIDGGAGPTTTNDLVSNGPAAGPAAAAPVAVVAAVWAPYVPGRNPILLAALSGQSYLVAVHLVDTPPGLTAQLLPVDLPELRRAVARAGRSAGGGDGGAGPLSAAAVAKLGTGPVGVADLAWDPRGERLAVLLAPSNGQGSHMVALYSTITDPLVSARLIGLARPSERLCAAAAATAGPSAVRDEQGRTGPASTAAAPPDMHTDSSAAAPPGGVPPPSPLPASEDQPTGAARRGALATISALPGSLTAARIAPLSGAGAAAAAAAAGTGAAVGPQCVVFSARVGQDGVYNLPCYL